MNPQIFLQARQNSTRFPNKILKKICGKTILNLITERLSLVKEIDKIILVTGEEVKNKEIVKEAKKIGLEYFCGNENNILNRFYNVAQKYNSEDIIRITGDCPLIDYEIINEGLNIFNNKKLNLICNNIPRTFPHGMDYEIFNKKHLEKNWLHHKRIMNISEFENSFINPVDGIFLNSNTKFYNHSSIIDNSLLRLTLDYEEDYNLIKKIYEKLYFNNPRFTLEDILKLIEKEPTLLKINQMWSNNN